MPAPVPAKLPLPASVRQRQLYDRAHAYALVDPEHAVVRVGDLDFAAFLLHRNVALINAVQINIHERYFDFWDPDGNVPRLAMEFVTSVEAKVLDCARRLKKVTYMAPQGRTPWDGG